MARLALLVLLLCACRPVAVAEVIGGFSLTERDASCVRAYTSTEPGEGSWALLCLY